MILTWVGPTEGVIFKENGYLLQIAKNGVKLENWIFQKYGKWVSWISYMFDLIHSTKDSDKKNSKKVTCRHTFGLGRKMGRNGCRA